MEELLKLLKQVKNDVDFSTENNLVLGGVLDSLDILRIVEAIDDYYNISIDIDDVNPSNFNDIHSMYKMINKYC